MNTKVFSPLVLALMVSLASAGVCAQGEADKAKLCFSPSEWVGKYPSDPPAGGRGSFFDLPCMREHLGALLPKPEYRVLREKLNADSQIEMMGRFLIVARCEAHNCPAHHAMVIVDTNTADIVVGVYQQTSANSRTTWYSKRIDPLELPEEVLENFLTRHNPK